jgi:hypothetical protein
MEVQEVLMYIQNIYIYIYIYLIKIPLKWLCTENVSHYNLTKKNSMGKNLSKEKIKYNIIVWFMNTS